MSTTTLAGFVVNEFATTQARSLFSGKQWGWQQFVNWACLRESAQKSGELDLDKEFRDLSDV
jgi:hypothetical protein